MLVLDMSMAAAWLLPEPHSAAAEGIVRSMPPHSPVPSLFWHEARSVLLSAERRGKIVPGEALAGLARLRRLQLEDAGSGHDGHVIALAAAHGLSGYNAAYLALAQSRSIPLATLDKDLAESARKEGVKLVGPLA